MRHSFIKELEKGSKSVITKKNAINYFIDKGCSTIPDLSKELNLSVPTVTKLITEMLEDALLIDCGKVETSGGRYPNLYGLNPLAAYFVGVDVKNFTVDIALIDFKGDLQNMETDIPLSIDSSAESLEALCDVVSKFISKLTIDKTKILNINVNIPGRVNPVLGHAYNYFRIEGGSLASVLKNKLGYDVSLNNDTRAMAYGEYVAGNVKNEKNVIFVNVSWGLAIGIIIDGRLYHGKSGFAGEFGHMSVFNNEIMCHCGKKGCLETEASGLAAHRILHEKIDMGVGSILAPMLQSGKSISLNDIIKAVNNEDLLCIDITERVGEILGRAIAGLINLLNPELVIIGGSMSLTGDYLTRPIKTAIKKYSLNLVNKDSKVVTSKLKEKAGIIGACLLARQKIFEDYTF